MLTTMLLPDWLERRHQTHCAAARRLYELRNLEHDAGEDVRARDLHDMGDERLGYALAIIAEFEAEL